MIIEVLEKKGKKQIILRPQFENERNIVADITEVKFSKMKVSKSKLYPCSISPDVIVLTESHN